MADAKKVTVDMTTPEGIFSFPRVFKETAQTKDDGSKSYDIQILIPKTDRAGVRALLTAVKKVGEAKWGKDTWKKVRQPLRDGDKEAGDLTEDGSTKGEKYPERLGHFFINARSTKPVTVVDRNLNVINDTDEIYGGVKGKINITFYPYSMQGNHGIGVALNGVQKIANGEPFGGGRPSVESMFDILEVEDDDDLDDVDDLDDAEDEVEEAPAPKKRTAKKKAAKKEPEPVEDDEEDDDLDEFDDLDDDL